MVGGVKMASAKENRVNPDFLNALFCLETKPKKKRNLEWESDLPECEIGEYRIVPLTTSRQLRAEGREMNHCIGRYDELCHTGMVRAFSIQNEFGTRVATASLIWRDDYWHLDQVKGRANAAVVEDEEIPLFNGDSTVIHIEQTDLYFVAQELLQRYRSAWGERLHSYVCNLMKSSPSTPSI